MATPNGGSYLNVPSTSPVFNQASVQQDLRNQQSPTPITPVPRRATVNSPSQTDDTEGIFSFDDFDGGQTAEGPQAWDGYNNVNVLGYGNQYPQYSNQPQYGNPQQYGAQQQYAPQAQPQPTSAIRSRPWAPFAQLPRPQQLPSTNVQNTAPIAQDFRRQIAANFYGPANPALRAHGHGRSHSSPQTIIGRNDSGSFGQPGPHNYPAQPMFGYGLPGINNIDPSLGNGSPLPSPYSGTQDFDQYYSTSAPTAGLYTAPAGPTSAPSKYPPWTHMFDGYQSAIDHINRRGGNNKWRPIDSKAPENEEKLKPFAIKIYDAMVDVTYCRWTPNMKNRHAETRWVNMEFEQENVEARAWQLAMEAVDLHMHGSKMFVPPGNKSREQMKEPNLNFDQRIEKLCTLFRIHKGCANDVMNGEKIDMVVGAPAKVLQRMNSNTTGNNKKRMQLIQGKKILEGIADVKEEDEDTDDNESPARHVRVHSIPEIMNLRRSARNKRASAGEADIETPLFGEERGHSGLGSPGKKARMQ